MSSYNLDSSIIPGYLHLIYRKFDNSNVNETGSHAKSMTTTRYVLKMYFTSGFMYLNSKEEFDNFKKSITTGCRFEVSEPTDQKARKYDICGFISMYYSKNNVGYHLVSNDDRRKIVRFLKQRGQL